MSTHRGRRVSRGLIGLLLVVLVLGGAFYLHNTGRSAAHESAGRHAQAAAPIAVMPTAPPTTAPAAVAANVTNAASTQPASSGTRSDVMVSSIPSPSNNTS